MGRSSGCMKGAGLSQAAYSDLKGAYHLDDIRQMRNGRQIVPRQVQLILSDLCNQDCSFCSYRMSNGLSSEQFVVIGPDGSRNHNPNRMIPFEKAEEIIKDCAYMGVRAIQFTGGGEPTVHPQHMELFALAQDLEIETGLVTNGVLFRNGWDNVLPNMAWVRVSIDAADAVQYSSVRRVSPLMYTRALSNVEKLASEIERQGTACLLGCGYVLTPENWGGLHEGVKAIRDTGAAYVRLSAMFSTDGDAVFKDIDKQVREQIAEAKLLQTQSFQVVDLYGDRISDLKQHAPDYDFCGYQQFNTYIGGNLKVYRCCSTAYTKHGEVGDLSDKSFRAWFETGDKDLAYRNFSARSCNTCQFNGKNRVINYLVGEPPVHSNFV